MSAKTVEEQLAELEMEAEAPVAPPPKSSKTSKAARQTSAKEVDALKELEELEALDKFQRPEVPRPISRPNTPKLSSSSTTSSNPRRAGVVTPSSSGSARTSEDKAAAPRKSAESARSFHQSFAPTEEEPARAMPEPKQHTGGSWWGGLLSTATATVNETRKRAEAAYQEIQKNEEAQRWAEQMRGNVGTLRGIGGELGKRALPTFESILHTLAPPISEQEQLHIHVTHDLVGYPSLDSLISQPFQSVMEQVQGGRILVIQRGFESAQRQGSLDGFRSGGGWNDGPWWRHTAQRDMGLVKGLVEGTKLARVSAETYARQFSGAKGESKEATKDASDQATDSHPDRISDIFLSIQAVGYSAPADLFASQPAKEAAGNEEAKEPSELTLFAVYLHDPVHGISYNALSQSIPSKWTEWMDAPVSTQSAEEEDHLPAMIHEIVQAGGIDPREWISDWLEQAISLAVGIVAQRYVARRMGVGEGSIGRGQAREAVVEAGGGEAARAGII